MATVHDPNGDPLLDPSGDPLLDTAGDGAPTAPVATPVGLGVDPAVGVAPPVVTAPLASPAGIGVNPSDLRALTEITVAPAISGRVVPGPLRVDFAGAVPARLAARVFNRSNLTEAVAVLDQALEKSFRDEADGAGSGSVTLLNDDPDLSAITLGDIIRFDVEGVPALSIIANEFDRTIIDQGEESAESTTISGPGTLAVLQEATIFPSWGVGGLPLQEERSFGWTTVGYDFSRWGRAAVIKNIRADSPAWYSQREIWPDSHTNWIWAPGATERLAANGTCYFLQEFYVGADTRMTIYAVGDDSVDVYLDGQHIIEGHWWSNDPSDMLSASVELEMGWHIVGAEVKNPGPTADIGGPFNPAGLAMSAHVLDAAGEENPEPVLWTDANWRCLAYPPSPPGMTPGRAIRMVIEEAQSRGGLIGVTLGFTDETDSAGNPWPVGNWTTPVGTDVSQFIAEMAVTDIDIAMSPAALKVLAWAKGKRAIDRDITYRSPTDPTDPMTGNIRRFNHREVS